MTRWIYIGDDYLDMMRKVSARLRRVDNLFADPDLEEAKAWLSAHVDLVGGVWDQIDDAPPRQRAPCSDHS